MRTVVITATGTGVGKTHVARALLQSLGDPQAVALKPIESGFAAESSDARALGRRGVWTAPLYALREPVSPHLAARTENVAIDLQRTRQWVDLHRGTGVTVVETAGGLFSPLSDSLTNLDLVRVLEPCTWLLVAPNRLGVLHDVGAALRAARSEHRSPDAVWLNPAWADHSTPSNAGELSRVHPSEHVFELCADATAPADALRWLRGRLGLPEADGPARTGG